MIKQGIIGVCMLLAGIVSAQRNTKWSRSELGFMAGGSYYIGDLNPQKQFLNTKPACGLIYRFNINSRLTYRFNVMYGSIEGNDAQSTKSLYKNRNLSFKSNLLEVGTGVEFNYFPFEIGHKKYKGTAYVLYEMALLHFNPTTSYNGETVELQPLGTEGQGSSVGTGGSYSLTQLVIPIGLGTRISFGGRASLGLEYGLRFMFTDYLDDVGHSRYADPAVIAVENGPLAAALSNRSLDGNRYGKRGNPSSRDWYTFFGATLTFKLGDKTTCWH